MAILRAGPWAEFGIDYFVDAPADFNTEPDQIPVNCVLEDWANDTWKVLWVHGNGPGFVASGTAGINEAVGVSGTATLRMKFCYQAVSDFDVAFDWSASGVNDGAWNWGSNTIEGGFDFDQGQGPPNQGTEIVTLPASTLGRFQVEVGLGGGTGTLSLKIHTP